MQDTPEILPILTSMVQSVGFWIGLFFALLPLIFWVKEFRTGQRSGFLRYLVLLMAIYPPYGLVTSYIEDAPEFKYRYFPYDFTRNDYMLSLTLLMIVLMLAVFIYGVLKVLVGTVSKKPVITGSLNASYISLFLLMPVWILVFGWSSIWVSKNDLYVADRNPHNLVNPKSWAPNTMVSKQLADGTKYTLRWEGHDITNTYRGPYDLQVRIEPASDVLKSVELAELKITSSKGNDYKLDKMTQEIWHGNSRDLNPVDVTKLPVTLNNFQKSSLVFGPIALDHINGEEVTTHLKLIFVTDQGRQEELIDTIWYPIQHETYSGP